MATSQFLPNIRAMTASSDGEAAAPIKITASRFDTGQVDAQIGRVAQALKLGFD
jgi:predicted RNA-binding protein YlqC (UPF0109 family)